MTDDEIRELHRIYTEGDGTIEDVALDAHVSRAWLQRRFQKLGLPAKPAAPRNRRHPPDRAARNTAPSIRNVALRAGYRGHRRRGRT